MICMYSSRLGFFFLLLKFILSRFRLLIENKTTKKKKKREIKSTEERNKKRENSTVDKMPKESANEKENKARADWFFINIHKFKRESTIMQIDIIIKFSTLYVFCMLLQI